MSTLLSGINEDKLKVRWEEPYVSEALNKVTGAMDAGVQFGFTPAPSGGASITLSVSSASGTSAALVRNTGSSVSVLYLETAPLTLDLSSFIGSRVYIGVSVNYTVGASTTGEVRAYTEAEYAAGLTDVTVLCAVDVPGAGSIQNTDIDLGPRDYRWVERVRSGETDFANGYVSAQAVETVLYSMNSGPSASGIGTSYEAETGSVDPKVIKFSHISGVASESVNVGMFATSVGESILIRFRRKLSSVTASNLSVQLGYRDGALASIGSVTVTDLSAALVAETRDWEYIELSNVSPTNARFVDVTFQCSGMSAGDVFIDAVGVYNPSTGRSALSAAGPLTMTAAGFFAGYDEDKRAFMGFINDEFNIYTDDDLRIEAVASTLWLEAQDLNASVVDGTISASASLALTAPALDIGSAGARISSVLSTNSLSVDAQVLGMGSFGAYTASIDSVGNAAFASADVSGLTETGTLEVGGGYGSVGLTVTAGGSVNMDGRLNASLEARRMRYLVGGALMPFAFHTDWLVSGSHEWIATTNTLSSRLLYIPVDVPNGAYITEYKIAYEKVSSGTVEVNIRLRRGRNAIFFYEASLISESTYSSSGITDVGVTQIDVVTNTDGGSGFAQRTTHTQGYFLEVEIYNSTSQAIRLYVVSVKWEYATWNPTDY